MDLTAHILLPYLLTYKYWAIFSITLIAALALPIPPGALLMASAALASQGYFSFTWVVIVGILGNIAGDNLGYWLARKYGRQFLYKIGFRKTMESQKYRNIEARIRRRPGALIFFSRFEVFSNLAVNLICGLSGLKYRKYLFFEVIGESLQVLIYCSIGYLVGENWIAISGTITKFLILILLIASLIIIIYRKKIWRYITRDNNN